MKKKISIWFSLIVTFSLVVMFISAIILTRKNKDDLERSNLIETTKLVRQMYEKDHSLPLITNSKYRATIVRKDGTVEADSYVEDCSTLSNHLDRPEIIQASTDNYSFSKRYSESLKSDMLYYAEKIEVSESDYYFIRVCAPASLNVEYYMQSVFALIGILILGAGFSILSSNLISKKVTNQFVEIKESLNEVKEDNYQVTSISSIYPEIKDIIQEINDLENKIVAQINTTSLEKDKLSSIISNITDGIIVINLNDEIEVVNESFLKMFDFKSECLGKKYINVISSEKINFEINQVKETKEKKNFVLELEGFFYSATIKPVKTKFDSLIAVILTDITNTVINERMRNEFFVNASHELKTPLTVIRGFNDVIALKNKDEALNKPIAQIDKETKRMQTLVNDMLKLSRLENDKAFEKEEVNFNKITLEVIDSLKNEIVEKNIEINIDCQAKITANIDHIYELVKNLVENAIRYNIVDGKVLISAKEDSQNIIFEVEDTGLGIAKEHQSRIFERFYRVEKSRSRQTGGTGLGLAIVKHICILYNAKINLESALGVGTKITVIFNK